MSVLTQSEMEKAELEAVLASEIFAKSPNLAKMLQYIGQKYFDSDVRSLKEYNIGVEALGRPPEFDPKLDSIVRVEAHRLREKLKRYYETEGADHPVIISLQLGHYAPQFLRRSDIAVNSAGNPIPDSNSENPDSDANGGRSSGQTGQLAATPIDSASTTNLEAATALPRMQWWLRWRMSLVSFAILLLIIGLGALALMISKSDMPVIVPLPSAMTSASVAANQDEDVRIIAGYSKKEYIDSQGRTWGPDRYYTGGEALTKPQVFIARAADPTLFATVRQGEFSYNIPLKPGNYELRLYFVETDYGPWTLRGGGEISRLFNIDMNGKHLITTFDVFSDAGGANVADERIFKDVSPALDGYLHLNFNNVIDYSILSALEIVPSLPGKIQPIRLVAQEHSYTDDSGRIWIPDRYSMGGRLIKIAQTVSGTPDAGLYSGERYGHFDYAIPVAEGRYGLTMRFAETYFGPANPGGGGVGSRVFDVYCNGVALLRNFDVFKEAGGENRALERTFHGLQPNAMGKIMLSFVPVTNYASVKAIEVVDESR
ncbi:MAG TPA: malectin domain-containing carbohydrate-binding protein [Terriglobia bacterium]|nr:malectin domain-containing carbohydrate-binding protein [Terriglobia bacterium]